MRNYADTLRERAISGPLHYLVAAGESSGISKDAERRAAPEKLIRHMGGTST